MSIVWLLFIIVGLSVAVADASVYRIPNVAIIGICVLFLVVALLRGSETSWLDHLGAGMLTLLAGIALFSLGQVGAGDAKLFASLSLWSGFSALIPLLFCVAVAAIVQLIVILGLRRIMPSVLPKLSEKDIPRILIKREGIPLGTGIAFGALFAARWFPDWLWLGHFTI